MTGPMEYWLEGTGDVPIEIGERFEISSADRPAWAEGWFEVEAFLLDGRIRCIRVEGPHK